MTCDMIRRNVVIISPGIVWLTADKACNMLIYHHVILACPISEGEDDDDDDDNAKSNIFYLQKLYHFTSQPMISIT